MSEPIKKRGLVYVEPINEFGAIEADAGYSDPNRLDSDRLYTPGWSELRRKRDSEMAEYMAGLRKGEDVSSLPVNVRMVRVTAPDWKTPTGEKMMRSTNDGYSPVTVNDIGKPWFTSLPPGARQMPDGTIVNVAGDLQYVWAPAERARLNARRKMEAATQQVEASAERTDGLLRTASNDAEPYARVEK